MNSAARNLRLVQIACILIVLACVGASRLGRHEWQGTLTAAHWLIIVGAIWSAIVGFTLQRRIVGRPIQPRRLSARSTAFTRWRAGHLARLWTAMTVGLFALCLSEFAGPPWLINVFFAVGLLLLLSWAPGSPPA
jgi:hypothetical protein